MRRILSVVLCLVGLAPLAFAQVDWSSRFSAEFSSYDEGEVLVDKSTKGATGGKWSVADGLSIKATNYAERAAIEIACTQVGDVSFKPTDGVVTGVSCRVAFSFCVDAFALDTTLDPGVDVSAAIMTVSDSKDNPKLVGWTKCGWVDLYAEGLVLVPGVWVAGFIELKTLGEERYVSYAVKIGDTFVRLKSPTGGVWMPTIAAKDEREFSQVGCLGVGKVADFKGDIRVEENTVYGWRGGAIGGWSDPANWTNANGEVAAAAPGATGDVVRIAGEVTLTNGSERVIAKDLVIGYADGVAERFAGTMRGDVALDVSRPRLGKKLSPTFSTFLGSVPEYGYRWLRGNSFKSYDTTGPLACDANYTPTESDLGHWLKFEVSDAGGVASSNEFFFSRLPVVYIDTEDGKEVTVKTECKNANLRIQGNDDFKEQYNGLTEIKGRGNSSWGYPKKPYKLKLDKKTNIFDYGKNKHWVLLSNWLDECFQRNVLAGDLADAVGVLRMNMTWVDVVFNGEFRGNYLLGEHLRVDKNRVNVFDWSDTIESEGHSETNLAWLDEAEGIDFSGGYIFELSREYDEVSKFTTPYGLRVMVNTPEYANTSAKMMNFIQSYWANLESGWCSPSGYGTNGLHYANMADIDSMVGYWLVMETMGNNDANYKSRFAYLDRKSKMVFGPVWDFDWGCGSVAVGTGATGWKVSKAGNDTNTVVGVTLRHNFYREWLDDPVFCQKAYECYWNTLRPYLTNTVLGANGSLAKNHAYLAESAAADNERWASETYFAKQKWTRRWFENDTTIFTKYLTDRLAWLDQQFASVKTLMASVKTASAAPFDVNSNASVTNSLKSLGFAADSDVCRNVTNAEEYVKFSDFIQRGGFSPTNAAQKSLAYTSYCLSPLLASPHAFAVEPQLKIADIAAPAGDGKVAMEVELKDGENTIAMAKETLRQMVRKSENLQDSKAWSAISFEDIEAAESGGNRVKLTVEPKFSGDEGFLRLNTDVK